MSMGRPKIILLFHYLLVILDLDIILLCLSITYMILHTKHNPI